MARALTSALPWRALSIDRPTVARPLAMASGQPRRDPMRTPDRSASGRQRTAAAAPVVRVSGRTQRPDRGTRESAPGASLHLLERLAAVAAEIPAGRAITRSARAATQPPWQRVPARVSAPHWLADSLVVTGTGRSHRVSALPAPARAVAAAVASGSSFAAPPGHSRCKPSAPAQPAPQRAQEESRRAPWRLPVTMPASEDASYAPSRRDVVHGGTA